MSTEVSTMSIEPNPAWRGDPLFLPEVFEAFGVPFREYPGWQDWGMGDFDVIQGVVWHHTGAANTTPEFIRTNPMLNNALSSQLHTAPDGLQTILGAGIAWHAGQGWLEGWPTNNANAVSIGFEMQHNGTDPWPEAQLDSTRRATAAILWFLGKRASTQTMIAHWEYSMQAQGKWDPGAGTGRQGEVMDMVPQRAMVNQYIDNFTATGNPQGQAPVAEVAQPPAYEPSPHLSAELNQQFFTDYVKGFVGPGLSDIKDIREQLTGGRDAGEYPGWSVNQLVESFYNRGAGIGTLPEIVAVNLRENKRLREEITRLSSVIRREGE